MYLIRVNGKTGHNNPKCKSCFVPGEPPAHPQTSFNYFRKCLADDFVRIGWPDVGDLTARNRQGALTNCYDWETIPRHVRDYLEGFSQIPVGSTVLMPNKGNPGELAIGTTTSKYYFFHNVPSDPYECAHRIKVHWDTDKQGNPVMYQAKKLGINIYDRSSWGRAFHQFVDDHVINEVRSARQSKRGAA